MKASFNFWEKFSNLKILENFNPEMEEKWGQKSKRHFFSGHFSWLSSLLYERIKFGIHMMASESCKSLKFQIDPPKGSFWCSFTVNGLYNVALENIIRRYELSATFMSSINATYGTVQCRAAKIRENDSLIHFRKRLFTFCFCWFVNKSQQVNKFNKKINKN